MVFVGGGIHVVGGRESPALWGEQEAVVAEMVVCVANSDVERYTAVELTQIVLHVAAVLEDEINDVEITVARLGIAAIRQTQRVIADAKWIRRLSAVLSKRLRAAHGISHPWK